jgi:hypothetical protein
MREAESAPETRPSSVYSLVCEYRDKRASSSARDVRVVSPASGVRGLTGILLLVTRTARPLSRIE